jgi:hypothetical protein
MILFQDGLVPCGDICRKPVLEFHCESLVDLNYYQVGTSFERKTRKGRLTHSSKGGRNL